MMNPTGRGLLFVKSPIIVDWIAWCDPKQAMKIVDSVDFFKKYPQFDAEGNKLLDVYFADSQCNVYFWDIGMWWIDDLEATQGLDDPIFLGEFYL
jgi:hypothetical protein